MYGIYVAVLSRANDWVGDTLSDATRLIAPHSEMVNAGRETLREGSIQVTGDYGLVTAQNGWNVNIQGRGRGNLRVLHTRSQSGTH
jgi:hypothetical protein